MNASRRSGAVIAALVLLAAAAALNPIARPYERAVAYRLGLRHAARLPTIGRPIGSIDVTAIDGTQVALRPRAGRAMLVNVFTTWCPPCQEETPALASASSRLATRGIDVVGVDQAESPAIVERFVQAYGLHYPTYIDSDRTSARSLDARIIPTTLLIDRDGIVRLIHVGPVDRSDLLAMAKEPSSKEHR